MDRDRSLTTPVFPRTSKPRWADSSRAGQWYNGNGYVGVSSPSYGTLTVFRQNSLTYDGVLDTIRWAPLTPSRPSVGEGITCGGGNTESCRHTTSLKYRLTVGQARVAAIWQFGGYGQNNASNGAYQVGVGGDIPAFGQWGALGRRNLQLCQRF